MKLLARSGIELDLGQAPARRRCELTRCWRAAIRSACSSSKVPGMRDALRKLKPDRFEDIIAIVALYRPGPMDNIDSYVQPQARPRAAGLSASRDRADPGRDLRRHHLPGAGDADRAGPVRLLARRSRSAAPRHGQEDQDGDGAAAKPLHRGRRRARASTAAAPSTSSSWSRNSPATASTNRTPRPMR